MRNRSSSQTTNRPQSKCGVKQLAGDVMKPTQIYRVVVCLQSTYADAERAAHKMKEKKFEMHHIKYNKIDILILATLIYIQPNRKVNKTQSDRRFRL